MIRHVGRKIGNRYVNSRVGGTGDRTGICTDAPAVVGGIAVLEGDSGTIVIGIDRTV